MHILHNTGGGIGAGGGSDLRTGVNRKENLSTAGAVLYRLPLHEPWHRVVKQTVQRISLVDRSYNACPQCGLPLRLIDRHPLRDDLSKQTISTCLLASTRKFSADEMLRTRNKPSMSNNHWSVANRFNGITATNITAIEEKTTENNGPPWIESPRPAFFESQENPNYDGTNAIRFTTTPLV